MNTDTLTLTDFLLARIAEDEAVARATPFEPAWSSHPEEIGQPIRAGHARIATCAESVMAHIARHDPARVLAECEAKRRIVVEHSSGDAEDAALCLTCNDLSNPYLFDHEGRIKSYPCPTLRALAAVYADHPDCRPDWRP